MKLENYQKKTILLLVLALICFGLFLKLADAVVWDQSLNQFDTTIANAIYDLRTPVANAVFTVVTEFASGVAVAAITAVVLLALYIRHRLRYFPALLLSLLGAGIFAFIFKLVFSRARPDVISALVGETGFSFPSGHSLVAICFYGILIYFATKALKPRWADVSVVIGGIMLILAVGFSRIYLGVHWPTDVLASYLLGGSWLSLLAAIFIYYKGSRL